ncbi:MAG: hypothetical protein B6I20_11410 [Bacteroidetes bacterium 4572_117]|nr:MAG: hypothetical protein B6I20_11410 [Bacteroidetes bacterium 4572_117]
MDLIKNREYKKSTNMKNIILTCVLIFPFYLLAQHGAKINIDTSKVEWKSFEETNKLFIANQKPVLIFLFDNNDDSSKLMLNEVYGLDEVANYVNALFYPIKMDVFSTDTITFFDGIKYTNTGKNKGVHDLAIKLAGGVPQTPSNLIFTKEAIGSVYPGFKDRDNIFPVLIYYAENAYKSTDYEKFEEYYFKTYPPGQKQIMNRILTKWKSLDEAFELSKKSPKKVLVNLYNNYSISCTMMRLKTFNNPQIARYLNEKFYCVNINVKTKDTLKLFDQVYINEGATHGYHQLPISFLNGKMKFPAFLIFDEESKFLDRKQEYMTPEAFEPVIKFVGDNEYKKQKWNSYLKTFKSGFFEQGKEKVK